MAINKSKSNNTISEFVDDLSDVGFNAPRTISNLGYRGIVSVKLMRGNRIVQTITNHNEGKDILFRSIASYLCGNTVDVSGGGRPVIPRYLDAGIYNASTGKDEMRLSYTPPTTGAIVSDYSLILQQKGDDGATSKKVITIKNPAIFTAFIPYDIVQNQEINVFRLLSSPRLPGITPPVLAQVTIDNAVSLTDASYNFVVEWVMSIDNYIITT